MHNGCPQSLFYFFSLSLSVYIILCHYVYPFVQHKDELEHTDARQLLQEPSWISYKALNGPKVWMSIWLGFNNSLKARPLRTLFYPFTIQRIQLLQAVPCQWNWGRLQTVLCGLLEKAQNITKQRHHLKKLRTLPLLPLDSGNAVLGSSWEAWWPAAALDSRRQVSHILISTWLISC